MTQDELALNLAEKALNNNFDPEAYIVKYIAEKKLRPEQQSNDIIVEDDTNSKVISNLLTSYYNSQSLETLKPLLAVIGQLLSELYHSTENKIEIEEMKVFIYNLQNIS